MGRKDVDEGERRGRRRGWADQREGGICMFGIAVLYAPVRSEGDVLVIFLVCQRGVEGPEVRCVEERAAVCGSEKK